MQRFLFGLETSYRV